MCCVVEMEDVLVRDFGGRLIDPLAPLPEGNLSNTTVMVCTLSFRTLDAARPLLTRLRMRGARVVAYVYDAWNVRPFFYNRRRRAKGALLARFRLSGLCDWLAVPFEFARQEFSETDRKQVLHLPLGVDSTLVDGMNAQRPITTLAYGRQPEALVAFLSERLNAPDSGHFLHHTDHFQIQRIHDFHAHRRHFWKLAQTSAVALAYDPRATHAQRFPQSIVGQRWFESLAAGCVVIGRRPATPEADQLLDWPEATLEAPDDPQEVLDMILSLAGDPARLREIRARNVAEIRARHDWRHRMTALFEAL